MVCTYKKNPIIIIRTIRATVPQLIYPVPNMPVTRGFLVFDIDLINDLKIKANM